MKKLLITFLILSISSLSQAQTIPWLFEPTNQAHPLGNNYMEFQDYSGGSDSYYHDGIDVMAQYGNRPVFAVADGVVTHITPGTMYGGIMIGENQAGGEGWLYWHILSSTMPVAIGDSVYAGDFIGRVATWSVASFHHVHFNKILGTGAVPWSWYTSTDNPLLFLTPYTDTTLPYFRNAVPGQKFAFAVNNTSNYLTPGNISGSVDIIANIADLIGDPNWALNPFQIRYWINGSVSIPPTMSFYSAGLCPSDATINVPYREDGTCRTQGNYTVRDYFFNITNTDGDSTVESTDSNYAWNTDLFPAGNYTIFVEARDRFGNTALDSMQINLNGGPQFNISVEPINPPITIPAAGGSFQYNLNITNTGASGGACDAWIAVTLPNGSTTNALLLRENLNIPAGGSISRQQTQVVPAGAPSGNYFYFGAVGDYPNVIIVQDGFNFTKLPN